MKNTTLTQLLNLRCAKTQKTIDAGEVVRLYDWETDKRLLGYASFVWDGMCRRFGLQNCTELNTHHGLQEVDIEDACDIYRTSPEKLNDEETTLLTQLI